MKAVLLFLPGDAEWRQVGYKSQTASVFKSKSFLWLGTNYLLSPNFDICFGDPWAAWRFKYDSDNESFECWLLDDSTLVFRGMCESH